MGQERQTHEQEHRGDNLHRQLGERQVGSGQRHKGQRHHQAHQAHQNHRAKTLVVSDDQGRTRAQQEHPDHHGQEVGGHQGALTGANATAQQGACGHHHGGTDHQSQVALQRAVFQGARQAARLGEHPINGRLEDLTARATAKPSLGADAVQAFVLGQAAVEQDTRAQSDGAHEQGQVEAVPQSQVVLGQGLTGQGRGRHVHERSKGGGGEQAHHDAHDHQTDGGQLHAQRWLVGVFVFHIAQLTVEIGVVHHAQGIGHAEHTGQRHQGGYCPSPHARRADHRFGEEHFLGQETVGQRHTSHGRRGHHGQRGGEGHEGPQTAELAHVARVGFVVHDTRDHEQRGLEGGVVEHVEDRGHGGQRRAQAHQESDQAQMADGRIGQQTLEVVFEDGDEGREQQGDQARSADQGLKPARTRQDGVQAHEQKHTGLDHGGRVQVSRDRRGRGHGVGQPEVKRELRALGERTHQDQQQSWQEHGVRLNLDRFGGQHADLVAAADLTQQHKAPEHGQAATTRDRQSLACAGAGVGPVAPIAHQQEGRNAGQLPEHHQHQEVVRQHHAQHGGHEQHHQAEELGRRIFRGQVVGGIQDDAQANEQNQAGKHERQTVQTEGDVQPERRYPRPVFHHRRATEHHGRIRHQNAQTGGRDGAGHACGQGAALGTTDGGEHGAQQQRQ